MRRPTTNEVFLIGCVLVLLPVCFLGYGSDNDTYTVLDSGNSTWRLHLPETSRNPGYWVFEAIVYALRTVGGSLVTNFVTLAMAITLVWRFLAISRHLDARYPYLVAACLAVTPVFVIAATSTDDYLWSLLGLVLFVELLLNDRLLLAILPTAFCVCHSRCQRAAYGWSHSWSDLRLTTPHAATHWRRACGCRSRWVADDRVLPAREP